MWSLHLILAPPRPLYAVLASLLRLVTGVSTLCLLYTVTISRDGGGPPPSPLLPPVVPAADSERTTVDAALDAAPEPSSVCEGLQSAGVDPSPSTPLPAAAPRFGLWAWVSGSCVDDRLVAAATPNALWSRASLAGPCPRAEPPALFRVIRADGCSATNACDAPGGAVAPTLAADPSASVWRPWRDHAVSTRVGAEVRLGRGHLLLALAWPPSTSAPPESHAGLLTRWRQEARLVLRARWTAATGQALAADRTS